LQVEEGDWRWWYHLVAWPELPFPASAARHHRSGGATPFALQFSAPSNPRQNPLTYHAIAVRVSPCRSGVIALYPSCKKEAWTTVAVVEALFQRNSNADTSHVQASHQPSPRAVRYTVAEVYAWRHASMPTIVHWRSSSGCITPRAPGARKENT
jgi:hypothetical protein